MRRPKVHPAPRPAVAGAPASAGTRRSVRTPCPIASPRGTLLTIRQIERPGGTVSRTRTPVVTGWFTGEGNDFRLLGTRCSVCASVFFPREDAFCRNPGCAGGELAETTLSPRGRVWSYTDSRY